MTDFYKGKVVIVTGAATGMGHTTAIEFAKAGAKVIIADYAEDLGRKTAEDIVSAGGAAHFIATDVSNSGSVQAMVDETVRKYGKLDCAFNNAGVIEENVPLAEVDEAVWDRTININLKGVFLCMKYQLPHMIEGGGGAIVNTSSVNAMRILPHTAAYTASKFGVVGLTRMAAVEYGQYNIRVNAILPGAIKTPMMEAAIAAEPSRLERIKHTRPLGRAADPIVIAKAALWLCSDDAEHVTGHSLPVDGGYVGAA